MWIPKFPSGFQHTSVSSKSANSVSRGSAGASSLSALSWWAPVGVDEGQKVFSQNILYLLCSPVFSAVGMPSVSRNRLLWNTLPWWLVVNGDERHSWELWLYCGRPRSCHHDTDPHLRIAQLAILPVDLLILENLGLWPQECSLLGPLLCPGLASHQFLHVPSLLSLLIWKCHWWESGLTGLQNSTSVFGVKIALNWKHFLSGRDLFFLKENNSLGSCCTEHLTGVRGISVLFPFPLLQLFKAWIFFSSASCLPCWSSKYFKARTVL